MNEYTVGYVKEYLSQHPRWWDSYMQVLPFTKEREPFGVEVFWPWPPIWLGLS